MSVYGATEPLDYETWFGLYLNLPRLRMKEIQRMTVAVHRGITVAFGQIKNEEIYDCLE